MNNCNFILVLLVPVVRFKCEILMSQSFQVSHSYSYSNTLQCNHRFRFMYSNIVATTALIIQERRGCLCRHSILSSIAKYSSVLKNLSGSSLPMTNCQVYWKKGLNIDAVQILFFLRWKKRSNLSWVICSTDLIRVVRATRARKMVRRPPSGYCHVPSYNCRTHSAGFPLQFRATSSSLFMVSSSNSRGSSSSSSNNKGSSYNSNQMLDCLARHLYPQSIRMYVTMQPPRVALRLSTRWPHLTTTH